MTVFQRLRELIPGQKSEPKFVRIVTDSTADLPTALATELSLSPLLNLISLTP